MLGAPLSEYCRNRIINVNQLLIKGRWIYIFSILVIGIISKITGTPNVNFSFTLMFFLLVAVCSLNLIYFFYFHDHQSKSDTGIKIMSFLQLTVDQFFYIIVIFFAGGLSSISFIFFFFNIIASAFFYNLPGVLLISTIASFLYSGLIMLQFLNILPFFSRYGLFYEYQLAHNFSAVFTNLTAIIVGFYTVGIFAGLIANSLRNKEKEVVLEKNKIKSIIKNLNDGLIYINKEGIIELFNPRAEKLLNIKKSQIINKNFKKINSKKLKNLKILAQTNKTPLSIIIGNEKINLKIFTLKIKNLNKEIIGTIKIIRDISREKFIDEMKYEFINITSHQLRTPLSGIKGALNMLLDNDYGKLKKKQKEIIKKIYQANEKIIKMLSELFNIYSIEEGRASYKFTKTDIKNILKKLIEKLKLSEENEEKRFILKFSRNIPKINLDANKIELALTGVIDNAIKYTPKNGYIKITCQSKTKNIKITIEDNGIGIPQKDQNKIFTKFFRASNAKKFQTEGNGLNLYVTKTIINKHGGKIWFTSQLNKGTTFYIELPIKK